MRIKYDSEVDILMLILRDDPPVDAIEEPGGVIVSYGEDKEPVSVEFMNASARHLFLPNEISVTFQMSGVR
jgi:uncharacterized protein YuzE